MDRPISVPHKRIDVSEARRLLAVYDANVENAETDPQKETRDKLEWAINNAEKLNVIFRGAIDVRSLNDIEACLLILGMRFPEGHNPFVQKASSTLH